MFDYQPFMGQYHPPCQRGVDNRLCIQGAIDSAAANGGGVVAIPSGTWLLSSSLRLPSHVTLRGTSVTAAVLEATGDKPVIAVADDAEGWGVENLTLDGGADDLYSSGAEAGIAVLGSSSFAILRRVLVRRVREDAIAFRGGTLHNIFIEGIAIRDCGRSAFVLVATRPSSGVFLSDISVYAFGQAAPRVEAPNAPCAALQLGTRCAISQLHIEPVAPGQAGIWFDRYSDYSVVSGLYVGVAGGTPLHSEPDLLGISLSTKAFRDLAAPS